MKSSILDNLNFYFTLGLTLLIPVFFLPVTSEYYDFNKQALLILVAGASLLIWAVNTVIKKQVRLVRSPLGLPLLAILASWVASSLFQTPNKLDAFLEPGQTGTIVSLIVIFFTTINSIHTRKQLETLVYTLIGSLGLFALISILWSSGLAGKIIQLDYLKSSLWSPTGNPFTTLSVLILGLPFLAILLIKDKSNPSKLKLGLTAGTLFLTVISSALLSYRLFFQSEATRPIFLPQSTSWSIALESLKSSALLGTGPGTYLSDFTRFRPISFNTTDIWNVRFNNSSNYYLQLLSTIGIIGLAAQLLFITKVIGLFRNSLKANPDSSLRTIITASTTTAMIALISLVAIPSSVLLQTLIIIYLAIAIVAYKQLGSSLVHEANIDIVAASDTGIKSPILPWIGLLVSILIVAPVFYLAGRAYLAEILFQKAIVAAAKNDGKTTYDTLIEAIRTNPYKDTYHVAYSQTNVLLANSIAASTTTLTDEQKNTIAQLIQQSVNYAKNAVALNPLKVTNVENLAVIYRNLISLAKDADAWTKASYQQAINLDPVNPNLRISLGGVFYSLKDYDTAITIFQQATQLKPNLANAYYNLSSAYKAKNDYQNALTAMQAVLNLLDKNSTDYPKAQDEANQLREKLGANIPTPTPAAEPVVSELEAPQPIPSPIISPPLELPDLGPEVTTTPEPTETPTP